MGRESMVFYRSFYDALKDLSSEQQGELTMAILAYALDDIEPELTGIIKTLFILIKPQLDANKKRAENGKYGVLGGRPKKPTGLSDTKPIGLSEENPNVNDNENVNVNVNNKRSKNKFCDFKQTDIDFEAIERKVFKN